MIKHVALVTLGLMALGAVGIAQNVDQAVKLEVVISRYQGETKVQSLPFAFRLGMNQQGSMRVGTDLKDLSPAESVPCVSQTNLAGGQQVGTTVDSTVRPAANGEFRVSLTFTERKLEGCRPVGQIEIPVFSNRIVAHVVTLKNGESTELVQGPDSARNTSTRITVTLTPAER